MNINLGWPQLIYLFMTGVFVYFTALKVEDDEARSNQMGSTFVQILFLLLLYWGGFFTK